MSLWARKSIAYISALFFASLTMRFFGQLVGPLYLHFDRPVEFALSLGLVVGQIVGWVVLSAFLYSRLAPMEAIRARSDDDVPHPELADR